ncbi:response regulator [Dongia deserti]|uniref:response regulator n=1 Tax=Dongia deserti TaxID=2268030 RepID=UPI000E64FECC|nr:response regulator [Dongia deserti]
MSRRLLSVDDDPSVLSVIRRVGSDLGFEVDTVDHGSFFMAAYARSKPDIVTLDLFMPEVDGIELIRWLGEVGCTARVILVSGASDQYSQMARRIGQDGSKLAVACLSKPFSVAGLRAVLSA